jgi:hypothetical protein
MTKPQNAKNIKSSQVLIHKLPSELLAMIFKRLKNNDLKASVRAGVSLKPSRNALNANKTSIENTPRMIKLLTELIDLVTKNFSSQANVTNTSNIKITKLTIQIKNKTDTSYFISYDEDFTYDSMDNAQDYKNNTMSLSRINFLIKQSYFNPAQLEEGEQAEYEAMMKEIVIEEYAKQHANFIDQVQSFEILDLKLENIKNNGRNASNASKTNVAKLETERIMTSLLT